MISDLQNADLKQSQERKTKSYIYILYFIYSGIPDLALGILKILTPLSFCDVLQAAV